MAELVPLRDLIDIDLIASVKDEGSYDSYPSPRTRQQMEKGLDVLAKAPDEDHRSHFREWLLDAVHDKESFADGPLETYLD